MEGTAAVIENGVVTNTILIDQFNFDLFNRPIEEGGFGWHLVWAWPLGLRIGDTTPDGVNFYRDGVLLEVQP